MANAIPQRVGLFADLMQERHIATLRASPAFQAKVKDALGELLRIRADHAVPVQAEGHYTWVGWQRAIAIRQTRQGRAPRRFEPLWSQEWQ